MDREFFMLSSIHVIFMELLTAAWFFVIGACLGSFLNVVIYRLPQGMTLLGQSFCPCCRCPISMRDNVPIVSWFRLRGRCRNCDCRISGRYWMVELAVGLLVLGLAVVEIAGGGINLPIGQAHYWGFAFNLFGFRPELFVCLTVHALLLITLLAGALIDADGHWPPPVMVLGVFCVLIITAATFPGSRSGTTMYLGQAESVGRPVGFGALATAVGAFLGWAIANATSGTSAVRRTTHFAVSLGLSGAALGVAPLLGITLIALPLIGRWGSGAIAIGATVHIFFWRALYRIEFAGDANRSATMFILLAACATAVWHGLRVALARRRGPIEPAAAQAS
jgi:prepilin signal peptidase PulO-like enzyme (type II secretory pathway)